MKKWNELKSKGGKIQRLKYASPLINCLKITENQKMQNFLKKQEIILLNTNQIFLPIIRKGSNYF